MSILISAFVFDDEVISHLFVLFDQVYMLVPV